jgi:hypothetical protein
MNFITEWTDSGLRGVDELPDHWVMYFDRPYTLKGAGASVVLIPRKVISSNMSFRLIFQLQITLQNTRAATSSRVELAGE